MEAQNDEIIVERAIMHKLDSEKDELILVDNEIELTHPTREFLSRLIETSFKSADDYAIDTSGVAPAILACRQMLSTCSAFVPCSRGVAFPVETKS